VLIGVISDTHNLLRPEALAVLKRSELILHAGDVCSPEVLEELGRIASVVAVRGNNDRGAWARRLPVSRTVEVGGFRIHILHDLKELDVDPRAEGFHAVVSGHSHRPRAERKDGVLFLNPGSAGPRRFKLPVAVAHLSVGERGLRARIVEVGASD
jgi:putative phosphoesterase